LCQGGHALSLRLERTKDHKQIGVRSSEKVNRNGNFVHENNNLGEKRDERSRVVTGEPERKGVRVLTTNEAHKSCSIL